MYDDRRKHRRRAALLLGTSKVGKIVAGGKLVAICALHDVSQGGACLRVLGTVEIPETFDLVLEAQSLIQSCRVAWKVNHRFGVGFMHAATAVPAGAAASVA
jgi:PilZ domain-containing protein